MVSWSPWRLARRRPQGSGPRGRALRSCSLPPPARPSTASARLRSTGRSTSPTRSRLRTRSTSSSSRARASCATACPGPPWRATARSSPTGTSRRARSMPSAKRAPRPPRVSASSRSSPTESASRCRPASRPARRGRYSMRSCPTATCCRTRSTSPFREMGALRKRIQAAASAAALLLVGLALPPAARASGFPVFVNDPVNSSTGRPYPVLPGRPLILPQPDGRFDPPIVDSSIIGDVDLVVRAGTMMAGPSIPLPSDSPRTAVAGGAAMAGGSGIPFTGVVSHGRSPPPSGNPLLGPEMDGIPVVVAAFADLDGDGGVGPTNADDAGAADDARELQESNYLVGRQVAIFHNGVAQGTLAVWKGAPASAGGLRVVLTAFAYVGPFSPGFFFGSEPDAPPIATRLPFFPRYDPHRVVEGNGRRGPAHPQHRLGVEMEPAFDPPVDDPTLDTPFALPTDGSSPTIDRVVVYGGPMSRLRCVRPSSAAVFPVGAAVPLYRGAAGALYEDLTSVDVPDNGRGTAIPVRLLAGD